jgi:hypothetical protein
MERKEWERMTEEGGREVVRKWMERNEGEEESKEGDK